MGNSNGGAKKGGKGKFIAPNVVTPTVQSGEDFRKALLALPNGIYLGKDSSESSLPDYYKKEGNNWSKTIQFPSARGGGIYTRHESISEMKILNFIGIEINRPDQSGDQTEPTDNSSEDTYLQDVMDLLKKAACKLDMSLTADMAAQITTNEKKMLQDIKKMNKHDPRQKRLQSLTERDRTYHVLRLEDGDYRATGTCSSPFDGKAKAGQVTMHLQKTCHQSDKFEAKWAQWVHDEDKTKNGNRYSYADKWFMCPIGPPTVSLSDSGDKVAEWRLSYQKFIDFKAPLKLVKEQIPNVYVVEMSKLK